MPHSRLDYEHTESTNSPPSISPQVTEVINELEKLEKIINPPAVNEEDLIMSLAA